MASDDPPDVGVLLGELVNGPAWHCQAACRGADPDLFFPERGDRPGRALALSESCSVRPQCLASALGVASRRRECGAGRQGGSGGGYGGRRWRRGHELDGQSAALGR